MARVRRKTSAATRWNLEIAGIVALGFALLLGVALVAPAARIGVAGNAVALGLHVLFGVAAGLFVVLIALVGAIVFLEINVPRMIATLGGAACAYFVLLDTGTSVSGRDGGWLGGGLAAALHALVGDAGAWIVLVVAALAVTVAITGVSLKKVIGWCVVRLAALRPPPRAAGAKGAMDAKDDTARAALPPGPASLREAFHLPALLPRAAPRPSANATASRTNGAPANGAATTGTAANAANGATVDGAAVNGATASATAAGAPEIPPPTHTVVEREPVRFYDENVIGGAVAHGGTVAHGGALVEADEDVDDEDDLDDDLDYDDDYDDDDEYDDDDADEDDDAAAYAARAQPAGEPAASGADGVAQASRIALAAAAVDGEYEPPASPPRPHWRLPDVAKIFDPPQAQKTDDSSRATTLVDTFASFGIGVQVTHIERGPSITRYELRPERGVKISRISSLADDIALALAATSIRIEAPIPGKSAVGIEVPNSSVSVVALREILDKFVAGASPLSIALGKDITGQPVTGDLGKMPHLLVAGATGAGKSVCLNCIIASLLTVAKPDELELLMIDPKRVELTVYNGIPHLKNEVITDPSMAAGALAMITREMDARYERFAKAGVRKIEEYNAKFPDEKLPYIVVIIDELADLMLVAPAKVEMLIMRLAQLARATGIHLVVATQRPSVDVITGLIKANIPSRIAFAVSSQVDSRVILDMGGAERLLGRGDMLYLPIDKPKPVRTQGALVSNHEIEKLVAFWKAQATPDATKAMEIEPIREDDERSGNGAERKVDELWYDASKFLLDARVSKGEAGVGSTAALQARFSIGHPRAVRLMKQLEEFGVVGPNEGTKPRNVVIESPADLERLADRIGRPAQTDLFAG